MNCPTNNLSAIVSHDMQENGLPTMPAASNIYNQYTIPRIIHFVWLTVQDMPPMKNLDTIIKWALTHPNWQIWLWVDKLNFKGCILTSLKNVFEERYAHVRYKLDSLVRSHFIEKIHISEQCESNLPADKLLIQVKDMREHGIWDELIGHEITRIAPDFGSASDRTRYKVLERFGGAYFDLDIEPGENSLDSIMYYQPCHVVYVEHKPQRPILSTNDLGNFEKNQISNDSLICTINNPMIRDVLHATTCNYYANKILEINNKNQQAILSYYLVAAQASLKVKVIKLTGPELFRSIINKNIKSITPTELILERTIVRRVRCLEYCFVKPLINTSLWLKVKQPQLTLNELIIKTKKEILFDARHYHILRLDSYISQLLKNQQNAEIPLIYPQALKIVLNLIKEYHLPENIKFAQVTGEYPDTIDYCKKNGLMTIFDIQNEQLLFTAIRYQIQFEVLAELMIPDLSNILYRYAADFKKYSYQIRLFADNTQKAMLKLNMKNEQEKYYYLKHLISTRRDAIERKNALLNVIKKIEFLVKCLSKFKYHNDKIQSFLQNTHQQASLYFNHIVHFIDSTDSFDNKPLNDRIDRVCLQSSL